MRRSRGRLLVVVGAALLAGVAVVGGLSLPPAGLAAIGLVAAAAACLVGGKVRESMGLRKRLSAVEAAVMAAGATAAAALVGAGLVVLAGGPTAALVIVAAGVAAGLVALRRSGGLRRRGPHRAPRPESRPAPAPGRHAPWGPPSTGIVPVLRPVAALSTEALGREWLLSTSVLGSLVDVGTRQSIVRRRQDLLDELERRDPAGFARWLAEGPRPGSDPSGYLHGDAAADKDAA